MLLYTCLKSPSLLHRSYARWQENTAAYADPCPLQSVCYYPSLKFLLGPGAEQELPWCNSVLEYVCAYYYTETLRQLSYRMHRCPKRR